MSKQMKKLNLAKSTISKLNRSESSIIYGGRTQEAAGCLTSFTSPRCPENGPPPPPSNGLC